MAEQSPDRRRILRLARLLGCEGTHMADDGTLMPCKSHEELLLASNRSEPVKKRRRTEIVRRSTAGAPETLPDGSLVSAAIPTQTKSAASSAAPVEKPRLWDPEKVERRLKANLDRHNERMKKANKPWGYISLDVAREVIARGEAEPDMTQVGRNPDVAADMEGRKRFWKFVRVSASDAHFLPRGFADGDLLNPDHPAYRP